jgi:type IV pilus assembly protein PilE
MNRINLRFSRGVTLMELLVVVGIIGILASIAVPTYRQYTVRTHRAAARACMSEAAQYMERYYTSNMKYEDAVLGLNCQTDSSLDDHYTITADDLGQRTYTITATPQGAQAEQDAACGTLTLNEAGARTAHGETDAAVLLKCWK